MANEQTIEARKAKEAKSEAVFRQAFERFPALAIQVSDSFGVPLTHLLSGNEHKDRQVSAARVELLRLLELEFALSNPQIAKLFRCRNHVTVMQMRKRMHKKTINSSVM